MPLQRAGGRDHRRQPRTPHRATHRAGRRDRLHRRDRRHRRRGRNLPHLQRQIRIAERLAPNGRLVALIHELAHALVAVDDQAPELDYAEGELIAESVAWTCGQTVGLDSSANSIPYLASWAEQASLEVLERAAALTGRLADRIEQALLDDDQTIGVRDWLS